MVGVSENAPGPAQAPAPHYPPADHQPSPYEVLARPPIEAGRSKRRWLWPLLISGWALLLLVLAVWSARNDPPTLRDQTTLTSARSTIDQVTATAISGVPVGWLVDDEGYDDSECDLSLARSGTNAVRTVSVSGPEGGESGALGSIAEALSARVKPTSGPPLSFTLDAGNYVLVRGKVTGAGTLVVELTSGCRIPS
jgi:hypothetical protein